MFLDLVEKFTGKPLTSDQWVKELELSIEQKLELEKTKYDRMVAKLDSGKEKDNDVNTLNMRMRCVHGDEVICDSEQEKEGGVQAVCDKFEAYVQANYAVGKQAA